MSFRPAGFSDSESEDDWMQHSRSEDKPVTQDTEQPQEEKVLEEEPEGTPQWKAMALGATEAGDSTPGPEDHSQQVEDFEAALRSGDVAQVSRFLSEGMSPNQQFSSWGEGDTPLRIACARADNEVMRELLKQEEIQMEPDSLGMTPIMAMAVFRAESKAEEQRVVECVQTLVDKGADAAARLADDSGMNALMFVAKQGNCALMQYLLGVSGVVADDEDSRGWTALCFATDQGHGDAARILLEAGANPDALTRDGLRPAELAAEKNFRTLQRVIESFGSTEVNEKVVESANPVPVAERKYFSEVDNILLNLNLSKLVPLFEEHEITLEHFLRLDDHDLERIGVEKVGTRKKLLKGIFEVHKSDWEKSSLPKMKLLNRQTGVYLTCPDAITMTGNMTKHVQFLGSTLDYMTKQIEEHPELLSYGQDVADVSILVEFVSLMDESVGELGQQLRQFKRIVGRHSKDPGLQPANRVGPPKMAANSTSIGVKIAVGAGVVAALVLGHKLLG